MSPANGLRPLAPPLLPGKGTHCPRPVTAFVFDRRMPGRWKAKDGGHAPTEVKEEGRAQRGPGERARTRTVQWTVRAWRAPGALSPGMEWEGARRPWLARRSQVRRRTQQTLTTVCNAPTTDGRSASTPGRSNAIPCEGSGQRPEASDRRWPGLVRTGAVDRIYLGAMPASSGSCSSWCAVSRRSKSAHWVGQPSRASSGPMPAIRTA
jgi:hypothetical protein